MNQPTPSIALTRNHLQIKKAIGTALLILISLGRPVFAQTFTTTSAILPPTASTTISIVEPVVEPVAPAPTVQEVLLNVCKARGYGEDCARTLLGMLWTESSNRSTVIGDSGKARGYFQIHYKLHNISINCAEDLVCSANWSLTYLEGNSYPKYPTYAVQCHNSCNVNNGYAAKVARYAKQFWNQPLEIKQPTPIQLAVNES